jgi:hypothetical protein
MTRRDYIKIAQSINNVRNKVSRTELYTVANELAIMLKEDNQGFNRDKFMDACGFNEDD